MYVTIVRFPYQQYRDVMLLWQHGLIFHFKFERWPMKLTNWTILVGLMQGPLFLVPAVILIRLSEPITPLSTDKFALLRNLKRNATIVANFKNDENLSKNFVMWYFDGNMIWCFILKGSDALSILPTSRMTPSAIMKGCNETNQLDGFSRSVAKASVCTTFIFFLVLAVGAKWTDYPTAN